jgi:hypothetical protein
LWSRRQQAIALTRSHATCTVKVHLAQ